MDLGRLLLKPPIMRYNGFDHMKRTFFVFLPVLLGALAAILLAAAVPADEATEKAMAAIKEAGGSVRGPSEDEPGWEVAFQHSGREVGDQALVHLAGLKDLVALNLRDTRVTDAGLVHLKGLTSLRRLHLERTGIGDKGVAHLAGLVNLDYLNLYGTRVTDKALESLVAMKKLRRLYLWKTDVTEEGAARLAKALPKLGISRGVDLSKLPIYTPPEKVVLKPKVDLKWYPATERSAAPKSNNGDNTQVVFENKSKRPVKLVWVSYDNKLRFYDTIEAGATRQQNTYSNNTWLITDTDDNPLGFFIVNTTKIARAIIPGTEK